MKLDCKHDFRKLEQSDKPIKKAKDADLISFGSWQVGCGAGVSASWQHWAVCLIRGVAFYETVMRRNYSRNGYCVVIILKLS